MGVDALRTNPLRTLLSTTGVVIGVAALVAAFAITDGVEVWSRALIARESSVQDVAVSPVTSRTVNGRSYALRGYPVFTPDDAACGRRGDSRCSRPRAPLTGTAPVEHLDRRANVLLTLSTAGLAIFRDCRLRRGDSTRSPKWRMQLR